MHITLYGATGRAGSRILTELLSRNHHVHAIVRDPARVPAQPNLTVTAGDLSSVESILPNLASTDAVVSAYAPPAEDKSQLLTVTRNLVAAIHQNHGPRLLVVGGAASLFLAPGLTLLDSGYLPAEWLDISRAHADLLQFLRSSDIDWTYFSPAAYFDPGTRTGKFRLGTDTLLSDENQQSRISMEDYAIALVDELESPRHIRARFTIGY